MTHTPDAKTQGLPEKIADRIADEMPWSFCADFNSEQAAALIRSELLGSELVKAADAFTPCQMTGAIDTRTCEDYQSAWQNEPLLNGWKCKGCRLRAALNVLRNEGKP